MSVTYATARAEIAKRAQEFLQSSATNGSTTTLVDANALNYADGYWDEATVLITSGTNNGLERRVQTYTQSTSTLTLYSSLAGAVASGDSFELFRRFGPTDILTATNRALNIAAPDFREKVVAIVTATQDTLQYGFPTGPDLMDKGFVALEYQLYTDASRSTWPYERVDPSLYEIRDDFNGTTNVRTLQIRFNPETNRLLRFVYDGPLGNVASPSDVIHLDLPELEWLYTQAAAELWRIEASRTTDATRQGALEVLARWESDADRRRRQLGQERRPSPLRRTVFRTTV